MGISQQLRHEAGTMTPGDNADAADLDAKIIDAMVRYGGSFVSRLGQAALAADQKNLQAIKDGFPHIWQDYASKVR